ncbi:polysaccharide deacetylase family protein [Pararhodonellum marinum]|uniref:polysaccharide deacetylase family protein n=1 Tax=Pararhodonellum marinum TaxID=2755358 RepID=UPI00188F8B75|nr:polysaccharide deacetylase family protein [Pararhodonellum marinum]
MVFHHVPQWIKMWYPGFIWNHSRQESKVYLTFDDGPVPGVTEYVLEELSKRDMKATFFMVGENVRKHPALALAVVNAEHRIGNHTQRHLRGMETDLETYLADVKDCDQVIIDQLGLRPHLFRPPYGRMTSKQANKIKKSHQIIMWDVLSGDYDSRLSATTCLAKTKKYTQEGSIVVFHDQEKTRAVIRKVLPDYLDFIRQKNLETALL